MVFVLDFWGGDGKNKFRGATVPGPLGYVPVLFASAHGPRDSTHACSGSL